MIIRIDCEGNRSLYVDAAKVAGIAVSPGGSRTITRESVSLTESQWVVELLVDGRAMPICSRETKKKADREAVRIIEQIEESQIA